MNDNINPQPQEVQPKAVATAIANYEVQRGIYSNHATVGHSGEEFTLDFFLVYGEQATLNARVILSPSHFKRLYEAIKNNIEHYESTFATIPREMQPKTTPSK